MPTGVYPHTHSGRGPVWTLSSILAALVDFQTRHQRAPTRREWTTANGLPSRHTVVTRLGSLPAVYRLAKE